MGAGANLSKRRRSDAPVFRGLRRRTRIRQRRLVRRHARQLSVAGGAVLHFWRQNYKSLRRRLLSVVFWATILFCRDRIQAGLSRVSAHCEREDGMLFSNECRAIGRSCSRVSDPSSKRCRVLDGGHSIHGYSITARSHFQEAIWKAHAVESEEPLVHRLHRVTRCRQSTRSRRTPSDQTTTQTARPAHASAPRIQTGYGVRSYRSSSAIRS